MRDYTQMNQLVEQFGERLAVLAFPCNQFGQVNQKAHEIKEMLIGGEASSISANRVKLLELLWMFLSN